MPRQWFTWVIYALFGLAAFYVVSQLFTNTAGFLTSIMVMVAVAAVIYGLIYFLIHDVYIHQRFKWFKQLDGWYSRGILRAHGAHHAKQEKEDGVSFGLLLVHPKYFRKKKK